MILQLTDEQQYTGLNNFFKDFQKNVKVSGIELGQFKDNFEQIKNAIKDDGLVNAIVFAPDDLEIDKVKEYNRLLADGVDPTEAYVQSMEGANEYTEAYVNKLDGASANLKQYTLGAKAATVGTKVLTVAIKTLGTALLIGIITEGITLLVKFIDNTIHAAEKAKEEISDLASEYKNSVSELEDLNSELETTKKQIDEIQSKGKISFTDQEELDKLKEQNLQLEKEIALQEKIKQQKANEVVAKIKKGYYLNHALPKKFDESLNNYIEELKRLEEYKKLGLEGIESGVITKENYDQTIGQMSDDLNLYYSDLLEQIQSFEEYRQSIIEKYNGNIKDVAGEELKLLNDITEKLNNAYKNIYSKEEYNKFVIEPIFKGFDNKNLQQEITNYLFDNINNLNTENLEDAIEEKFGVSIINALRQAAEEAGFTLPDLLNELFNQAQNTTYGFLSGIKTPTSSYEAQQYAQDKQKKRYFDSLDDETKKLIINAEIPEDVKTGTLEDMKEWIKELQKEAVIEVTPFSPTDFSTHMETLSSLSSLYENFKTNLDETGEFSPLDITEVEALRENFKDYVYNFDELERILTSSETSAEEAQKAFDTLASEYIITSGALKGLNSETRDQIVSQLELNGIINASEIITEELAELYDKMAKNGYNLAEMTEDEIKAFFDEANASNQARLSLARLEIAKELLNMGTIDTSDEVESLLNIARAAGVAELKLLGVRSATAWITGANGMPSYVAEMMRKDVTTDMFHLDDYKLEYDSNDGSDNGSKAAEKEASDLLDKLLALYEAELNNGLITFDEFVQKSKDTIEQFYKEGKIKAEDYWNYIHNLYEKQISYMDKVISAVTSKIDDEIDNLEKKKESIEEIYNKQIKSIQEEIDILEKANQKRKDAIDLQKALYALRRAENQRTNLVYSMPNSTEM